MMRYHIVEVLLTELSIFQWKGKGVGAPSAHYVMEDKWNYIMLYMYMNMEEVQPYFDLFNKTHWKQSGQPILKQLDSIRQHGVKGGPSFSKWFRLHYMQDANVSDDLWQLSLGLVKALEYGRYDINGYRFQMVKLEASRPLAAKTNSGVVTSDENTSGLAVDYYGIL
jgi:hypothetical protein